MPMSVCAEKSSDFGLASVSLAGRGNDHKDLRFRRAGVLLLTDSSILNAQIGKNDHSNDF